MRHEAKSREIHVVENVWVVGLHLLWSVLIPGLVQNMILLCWYSIVRFYQMYLKRGPKERFLRQTRKMQRGKIDLWRLNVQIASPGSHPGWHGSMTWYGDTPIVLKVLEYGMVWYGTVLVSLFSLFSSYRDCLLLENIRLLLSKLKKKCRIFALRYSLTFWSVFFSLSALRWPLRSLCHNYRYGPLLSKNDKVYLL